VLGHIWSQRTTKLQIFTYWSLFTPTLVFVYIRSIKFKKVWLLRKTRCVLFWTEGVYILLFFLRDILFIDGAPNKNIEAMAAQSCSPYHLVELASRFSGLSGSTTLMIHTFVCFQSVLHYCISWSFALMELFIYFVLESRGDYASTCWIKDFCCCCCWVGGARMIYMYYYLQIDSKHVHNKEK